MAAITHAIRFNPGRRKADGERFGSVFQSPFLAVKKSVALVPAHTIFELVSPAPLRRCT